MNYEGKLTEVCDVIMQHYFPKSGDMCIASKTTSSTDRFTYQWALQSTGTMAECPFLVKQCKRIIDVTEAFKDSKNWLQRDLPALAAIQT